MNIDIQPDKIIIFHIGGSGQYGPVDTIINLFPSQCIIFAFEARDDSDDVLTKEYYNNLGTKTYLVNSCIAGEIGERDFYVNKHIESSSLFPPSEQTLKEHIFPYIVPNSGVITWGENTELDYTIKFKTINLESFIDEYNVIPDILSIDAQGAELEIMVGMGDNIKYTNTIVSEVEFFEIYKGQGLFHEQVAFLSKYGIRLAELLSPQMWSPGPEYGKGFLTVAEALWFKNIDDFFTINKYREDLIIQGIKLAIIGYAFDRFSYSYILTKKLMDIDKEQVVGLCYQYGYEKLLLLVDYIDNNLENYKQDPFFFINQYDIGIRV
jgi:FkbM family methyltransferase